MSDDKVLSKEEVDALLSASKANSTDLSKQHETDEEHHKKILDKITGLTVAEYEKTLGAFLRRKLAIKHKATETKKMGEYFEGRAEKQVYTIFQIKPHDFYGMIVIDLSFLHQAISYLYGGTVIKNEAIIENPGKVGLIIAEKISQLCVEAFSMSGREYGEITCNVAKTITQPNLSSKLNADDQVCIIEMSLTLGETETVITMMVMEQFFNDFFAVSAETEKHIDNTTWRSAIETQVADTCVVVHATLPNVTIKLNDLMSLQKGGLIPISDPTLVYISLNDLKLFRANVGQSNSKRVAKILSEV